MIEWGRDMNKIEDLVKELIYELLQLNLEELRELKAVWNVEMNRLNMSDKVVAFCNKLIDLVIENKQEKGGCSRMKREIFEISAEINGISNIIIGLSNQLDNSKTDTLSTESMRQAMVCISTYLDRIVEDLEDFDMLIAQARRKEANRMGKVKELLITILSTSTDQELQAMLEDDSASEIAKECIKEEINFRKGGPNNE